MFFMMFLEFYWKSVQLLLIIIMRQQEGDCSNKRISLKQLSDITQIKIFDLLQVHSQPSEYPPQQMHFHLRKFSKPVLPLAITSPHDASPKRLPPILRYLSQKFVKQAELKRQEQQQLYKGEKKFKIHTHSLSKLEALNKETMLSSHFKSIQMVNKDRLKVYSEEQTLKKKIHLNKINKNNHIRSGSQVIPCENTLWRGEKISGWQTHQYDDI